MLIKQIVCNCYKKQKATITETTKTRAIKKVTRNINRNYIVK